MGSLTLTLFININAIRGLTICIANINTLNSVVTLIIIFRR